MTASKKAWISMITTIAVMLILPTLALRLNLDPCGMGLFIILFFIVNPLTVISLSIAAGTDLRRLWWIPLVASVAFAPLFWIAIWDVDFDLFVYSAIYLGVALPSMLGTHFGIRISQKRNGGNS